MLKKRGWVAEFPTTCGGCREILMEMKKLAMKPVSVLCKISFCKFYIENATSLYNFKTLLHTYF